MSNEPPSDDQSGKKPPADKQRRKGSSKSRKPGEKRVRPKPSQGKKRRKQRPAAKKPSGKRHLKKRRSRGQPKKKEMSPVMVWVGTFAVTLVILSVSYYISQNISQPAPSYDSGEVYTQQAQQAVEQPPSGEVEAVDMQDQSFASTNTMAKESETAPIVPDGPAVLDLANLVGMIEMNVPSLWPENDRFPLKHSCYRQNQSPPVKWGNAPAGTKSYVIFFEKIAADASPFLYWSVYNIPADKTTLGAGQKAEPVLADGVTHGENEHGVTQYTGPCDPKGVVDYRFRIFALDTELNLEPGLEKEPLIRKMNGHIIDMAEVEAIHYLRR